MILLQQAGGIVRITCQRVLKPLKLLKSNKFTVVWNNRYTYTGKIKKFKGEVVTLVKFNQRTCLNPLRPFMEIGKFLGWRPKRKWTVALIENGKAGDTTFKASERELEHVGKNDISKARASGDWVNFEMLGNVNKCNLTDLRLGIVAGQNPDIRQGKKLIAENDVPGYGELYGHCVGGKNDFNNQKTTYKCNYCKAGCPTPENLAP